VYCDHKLHKDYDTLDLTHTWAPSLHFDDKKECALIWASGQNLDSLCPENLREQWQILNERARAFIKSFQSAKIKLENICFYDAVPKRFLLEYYDLKNKITQSVFDGYEKPGNYDFMYDLFFLTKKIQARDLNLNYKNLNLSYEKIRKNIGKIKNSCSSISYDPWKTSTGRLTTTKNSFPILTLNKELRSVVQPHNDVFVELDFNAAELRVLFALLEQNQPDGDIHSWINKNIFDDKYDRDTAKKKVFSWLYNPKAKNKKLNNFLNREKIYEKYYKNGAVKTPYGRNITVPEEKAVNFLIQSTTSDMFLTSAIEIDKMLENKKSFLSFCIHDSLVIDFAKEDKSMLQQLIKCFSNTRFGHFKTNLSFGRDFGRMRKII